MLYLAEVWFSWYWLCGTETLLNRIVVLVQEATSVWEEAWPDDIAGAEVTDIDPDSVGIGAGVEGVGRGKAWLVAELCLFR